MRTLTLMTILTFSMLFLMGVFWAPALAEEVDYEIPPPKTITLTTGVICDTEDELRTLLSAISLNGGREPETAPAGCGRITRAYPAVVTPLEWYVTPLAIVLIARFEAPDGWTQYGWVGYRPNPDYKPASFDIDA